MPPESLYTSCICLMEMREGAARLRDGGVLWRRIEREIVPRVQILGFELTEALVAGDVLAHLFSIGQPIDVEDVMIGATARTHHLVLVTHNGSHFRRIPDLVVEDWIS